MKKSNLLIFGANEFIYGVAQDNLDFFKINLIGFVDNDINKHNLLFCHKQIYSVSAIQTLCYDYILVGAWASYRDVKTQLLDSGIAEKKIMPLLSESIYELMHEAIADIQMDTIGLIYKYPRRISVALEKLNKNYNEYKESVALENECEAWYLKSKLIAHACGGYVKGCKCLYSNSKEALEFSLAAGFKIVECDLWAINEDFYLAHHASALWEADGMYTLLRLEEALKMIKCHPEVNLLIDVKWAEDDWYLVKEESIQSYMEIVDYVDKLIIKVSVDKKEAERLKKQLVMEVYNGKTMAYARQKKYNCVYTLYRNKEARDFMQVASECVRYEVHSVAMYVSLAIEKRKDLKLLKAKNLKIFCYSTDDLDEYSLLLSSGVDGVFTNWMLEQA